jgi:acyl-CoA dehydrogenase
MVGEVIDRAMQVHGAEGICRESKLFFHFQRVELVIKFRQITTEDTPLAALWAGMRTLRFADGPDEVHIAQIGAQELKRAPALWTAKRTMEANEEKIRKAAGLKASHL